MKFCLFILLAILFVTQAHSQGLEDLKFSGNAQLDAQMVNDDDEIGAKAPKEKVLSNNYFLLNFSYNNFSSMLRYEAYLNPMLGFDPGYGNDQGLAFRNFRYHDEQLDVTAGNFYEQFGSGMIFRTYDDRALGFDNSMDGMRVKFKPTEGLQLTGMIGKQRAYWGLAEGIVRGGDVDMSLNDLLGGLGNIQYNFGASVISKFQTDKSSKLVLPENVLSYALRGDVVGDEFSLDGEYVYKYNDPSEANQYNYNPGQAFLLNASYFPDGIGASLSFHSVDNMPFYSDRNVAGQVAIMNYIPPLTKQHAYRLTTIYPYATQMKGEIGARLDLTYTLARKSSLGGKYGTTINFNASQINSLNKTATDVSEDGDIYRYESNLFEFGDHTYFRDVNIGITRKFTKNWKVILTYVNLLYDRDVIEKDFDVNFSPDNARHYGLVTSNIGVLDVAYKIDRRNSIRMELQYAASSQDMELDPNTTDPANGDWGLVLTEYTYSPHWFLTVIAEKNLTNANEDLQLWYLSGAVTYVTGPTRFAFGYGRQREGILCVGGVCRPVPASNGFTLGITTSF
jgi:uncharacterized protein DUF6029